MGAYDVRCWLVPANRVASVEDTDAPTSDGGTIKLISFPLAAGESPHAAAAPRASAVREWLAGLSFESIEDGAVARRGRLRLDLFDQAGRIAEVRVTIEIYSLTIRTVITT